MVMPQSRQMRDSHTFSACSPLVRFPVLRYALPDPEIRRSDEDF